MNETDLPDEFRSYRLSQLERTEDDAALGKEGMNFSENTNFCQLDGEDAGDEAIYVDLMKNPERFTGYAGTSANRVWRSIYDENCFGGVKWMEPARSKESGGTGFVSQSKVKEAMKSVPLTLMNPASPFQPGPLDSLIESVQAPIDPASVEQCLEKRVFYRVISGLHASISIHICNEYLDQDTMTWGPNLECFLTRISQHPERLQNVYFDYVIMMRALSKAGEYLDKFSLRSGDEIKDEESRKQLSELLQLARENRPSFDEHKLFTLTDDPNHNRETLALKEDFRMHFRNISRIMDCVGCDKCRLWGKVQITGVGTALKLLFAFEESETEQRVELTRNELVALINTAHRISESVCTRMER
ncbi:endoplasmic oxidoreductin 1 precursor [Malassezia pachydermatis]|uniref:Endoplasmic oxidoreductin 1 n=1 Tax=Malassezia pachydermatis TaxID=77020 RepID=A0A0M8MPJ7_9BASI|nr:endoplasmic oxidoreductin 1 precursor [Malassezia pachydermatis]KOS14257.1 endoplasmic oxidoreductin 1 precursor [Malassezia pachydermatis]